MGSQSMLARRTATDLAGDGRHRALFDASRDAICVFTMQGRIVDANPAAVALFGYSRDELVTLHASALCASDADSAAFADHEAVEREILLRHRNGSGLPAIVTCAPRVDTCYDVIVHDMRAAKQVEAQLRHAAKMETMGRLTGGIAHDFNNLLTAIIGYAELLQAELPARERAGRDVREICRAAHTAAALTQRLLAFSRQQPMETSVQDVRTVVAETKDLLRRLIGQRISLDLTTVGDAATTVVADACEIEQIVLNLAVNARDAMQGGGRLAIVVRTADVDASSDTGSARLAPGPYVCISVADTGSGMDAETVQRIFEPFFTTKGADGTGLGLATVHDIVRQRGGGIAVVSARGEGTTFEVFLPAAERPAVAPKAAAARGDDKNGGGGTVLVAEDDPGALSLIATSLRRRGYQVLEARKPIEALAIATAHTGSIDLLISDCGLPQMAGAVLAQRIRELRPAIKALFVSGYSEDYLVAHEGLVAGSEFLQKPLLPTALVQKVRDVLGAAAPHAVQAMGGARARSGGASTCIS